MIDDDSEIIESILSGDPSKYELIIKKYQETKQKSLIFMIHYP